MAGVFPRKSSRSARDHTRVQALAFVGKAWVFRAKRSLAELGSAPPKLRTEPLRETSPVVAESRSPLYSSSLPAEFRLQAGKVQNLRVAAAKLHGVRIPAGALFSFWAQVPRPIRARGFVDGRELREGCIIPSVGGGLCQLSNALYDVALQAGCEVVERHAHSQKLPGSMAEAGRDATVFWNYVDLRFRPAADIQLEVRLTAQELIVRLRALAGEIAPRQPRPAITIPPPTESTTIGSCETCGVTSCFRHLAPTSAGSRGIAAWLVDAWWPEFDAYLQANRQPEDWLFTPLDGARFRIGPYRWCSRGFAQVRHAPLTVLRRSLVSRRLAAQGAERQRTLLRFDETLARSFARRLPAAATHLVVSQNLLPFLWRDGVLGGRTFDVLITRLPLREIEATLDRAHHLHPESRTLADFRADPALIADETAALAAADSWITPHSAIAALAGCRARKLDWTLPPTPPATARGEAIVFPASTLGRKGAYELRETARRLDLEIRLGGPIIEDATFWQGLKVCRTDEHWLASVAAVVLPAWIENQPRRLLAAIAAGVPVIASESCGLAGAPGVIIIETGNVGQLIEAIQTARSRCSASFASSSSSNSGCMNS